MDSEDFDMEQYKDIVPLPIELGLKNELCQIMYTDEYKEVMGIARALIQVNELSVRALNLTAKVIDLAPAFYTIWNYRFSIIKHLIIKGNAHSILNTELDWLDEITLNNPKNYQIWSYRQSIISQLHPDPSIKTELPILEAMIDDDTKNYHVWSYRKWCVSFFKDFEHELSFVNKLVDRDIYNNSAWNHRMFIMKNIPIDDAILNEEINYVKDRIELVPQNVSSWNYLRGLYSNFKENKFDDEILKFAHKFVGFDLSLNIPSELPSIESSFALEFIAFVQSTDKAHMNREIAINSYQSLATKYDPIRKNFWNYKIKQLEQS